MNDVWLVTGLPGAGKTTVARSLAAKMDRAAHIEGDLLRRLIVADGARPEHGRAEEVERQMALNVRNQCLLARSFNEAEFTAVLDHWVFSRKQLEQYQCALEGLDFRFVVLAPQPETVTQRDRERAAVHGHTHEDSMHLGAVIAEELGGVGLWLDTSAFSAEETVEEILRRKQEAKLKR